MHTPTLSHRVLTLFAIVLLWLSWAAPSAQWALGPYNNDWKKHINKPPGTRSGSPMEIIQPPPLVYRVAVLPRNDTAAAPTTLVGNGTYYYGSRSNATTPTTTIASWNSSSSSNTTAVPANTTTTTTDTTCGVASPLFALQVVSSSSSSSGTGNTSASSARSPLDGWWLRVSGSMVLLTSQQDKATGFGVGTGATRNLCVPRGGGRRPLVAVVEARLQSSPLYLLDPDYAAGFRPEYEPLACGGVGERSQLACSQADLTTWSACGMQLEIGSGQGVADGAGLNCSSITLRAFQS